MRLVRRVACPRRHWAVDPGGDLGEDRVDLRVRPGRGVLTASGVGQPFSVPNWARISTVSMRVGYARVRPDPRDAQSQRDALAGHTEQPFFDIGRTSIGSPSDGL